jgi:hypothetical protein
MSVSRTCAVDIQSRNSLVEVSLEGSAAIKAWWNISSNGLAADQAGSFLAS